MIPEKWFIEPTKETVLEISKWFDENHGDESDKTFYQNDKTLIFCYSNHDEPGSVYYTKSYLLERNIPEITIEQFRKYVSKTDTTNKEIIGYKLLQRELIDAVKGIISTFIDDGKNVIISVPHSIALLKKYGVLDLWFEPIYERFLDLGDIVYVEFGGFGAATANGSIGRMIEKPNIKPRKYGGEYWEDTAKLYIDCKNEIYGLCKGYRVRLATKEEQDDFTSPKLPEINGYNGKIGKTTIIYGCAIIPRSYFEDICGTRDIKSLVLSSGVEINEEQVEQIKKVIKHLKTN